MGQRHVVVGVGLRAAVGYSRAVRIGPHVVVAGGDVAS
jgi:hypothetical protein